jgi:hypothetical protein
VPVLPPGKISNKIKMLVDGAQGNGVKIPIKSAAFA